MQFYIFFFFCIRFLFFSFSVTDIFGLSEQLYPDCCSPLRRLCSRRFIFRSSVLIPPPSLRCFFPPLKKKKTHAKWVAVLFRCYVLNSRVCFKKPPFVWLCPAKQALPFKKKKKKSLNWSIVWPSARRKCSLLYFIRVESLFLLPYKNSFGKVTNIESTAQLRVSGHSVSVETQS